MADSTPPSGSPDPLNSMPGGPEELSDGPEGATAAALERAHSAVLDAEERARHPQANPLARPRLKAAQDAEQRLLDQLGYATYSEATFSGFRTRSRPAPEAPDSTTTLAATLTGDLPPLSSSNSSDEVADAVADEVADEVADAVAEAGDPGALRLHTAAPLSTPPGAGQARQMPSTPSEWDQLAGPSEEEQVALLARLRVVAADFVDAEVLEANTTSAQIVDAARREAQAANDAARKVQETAAVATATTASDLEGLLGLIDDLMVKLSAAHDDVRSRIDLLRWTSQKSQESSGRAVPAPSVQARREDSSAVRRPNLQSAEA